MTKRRKILWAAGALVLLLFFAAISLPNLMRSHQAPQETALSSRMPSSGEYAAAERGGGEIRVVGGERGS
jgi:hypothetical protein